MTDSLVPPAESAKVRLSRETLERLRDQLRKRGQRQSIVSGPKTSADLVEAMQIVEEYGPICEAMYLVMSADQRVVNSEREVLRGALDVLSDGVVRSMHMEAMLDAAARRCAAEGRDVRLKKVVALLREDTARAEATVVLAAAIAAADERIVAEESVLIDELFSGLGIDYKRANELLANIGGEMSK